MLLEFTIQDFLNKKIRFKTFQFIFVTAGNFTKQYYRQVCNLQIGEMSLSFSVTFPSFLAVNNPQKPYFLLLSPNSRDVIRSHGGKSCHCHSLRYNKTVIGCDKFVKCWIFKKPPPPEIFNLKSRKSLLFCFLCMKRIH